MKNITIGTRLISSFRLCSFLVSICGKFGYSRITFDNNNIHEVSTIYFPSIRLLNDIRYNMRNYIVSLRSLSITNLKNRDAQYKDLDTALKDATEAFNRYAQMPKGGLFAFNWETFAAKYAELLNAVEQSR